MINITIEIKEKKNGFPAVDIQVRNKNESEQEIAMAQLFYIAHKTLIEEIIKSEKSSAIIEEGRVRKSIIDKLKQKGNK